MNDFKITIEQSSIDPTERKQRLAEVYRYILSWEEPKKKSIEPATGDLSRESATRLEFENSIKQEVHTFPLATEDGCRQTFAC